ncbi:uncharacterized protein LOC110713594 [Chenopodium quinoa]|uniref:uncharacterized protein LOC110713594 n=1 Tax=Chenopodium quinoa TaxID=63459 RepID=UPI000B78635F|nr:uncharacterized protein LOC110713594 [Chenopodium quinoa]
MCGATTKAKKHTPKKAPPQSKDALTLGVRSSGRRKQPTAPHLISKKPPLDTDASSPTEKKTPSSLIHNAPKQKADLASGFKQPTASTKTPSTKTKKKTTSPVEHQRQPSASVDDFEWYDNRPDSPLTLNELIGDYSEESDSGDPTFVPECTTDKGKGVGLGDSSKGKGVVLGDSSKGKGVVLGDSSKGKGKVVAEVYSDVDTDDDSGFEDEEDSFLEHLDPEVEDEFEEEILEEQQQFDSDVSDDEYNTARERVNAWNKGIVELAQNLQREAAAGRLSSQAEPTEGEDTITGAHATLSDADSEEDEDTPPSSEAEDDGVGRRRRSSLLVGPNTDFSQFKWKVG